MAQQVLVIEQQPVVVHTRPAVDMDEEQFFQFCQLNRDLQIERTAQGDIVIMAPEAGSSGRGSAKLIALFDAWAEADGTGQVFGPSTGFNLPNGATRSPDVLRPLDSKKWLAQELSSQNCLAFLTRK